MQEQTKWRAADMLLPAHAETREAHRIDVAWRAVGYIGGLAVIGNDYSNRVAADRRRAEQCSVL
jgi:hypothetical protein